MSREAESPSPPWEEFLAEHFPGYLLPEARRQALSEEEAARFLERLSGNPQSLFLLRASSLITAHREGLSEFIQRQLPLLVRALPERREVVRREQEGRLEGRLDVPGTLQRRMEGRSTQLVGRSRQRLVDLPENVLIKAVAERLVHLLAELRGAGGAPASGWGEGLSDWEGALRRALSSGALREVSGGPIDGFHEQAARAARHPAYALGLALHRALREGLDDPDPEAIARLLARGALTPLEAPARFEVAVLLRLIQALAARLPGFRLERTLIVAGRREVAVFTGPDGARLRIFYNQAYLDPGPRDRGVRHYLGQQGRLRPDITLVVEPPGGEARAAVIEAKLSSDPAYLVQGFEEARLYRAEYAERLIAWPKAILVALSGISGAPRREDEVVAVGWNEWTPAIILEGLTRGLQPSLPSGESGSSPARPGP